MSNMREPITEQDRLRRLYDLVSAERAAERIRLNKVAHRAFAKWMEAYRKAQNEQKASR